MRVWTSAQKIELVTYDDQAKSDQAIFTANKLIGEDGVKLVVNGSYSASGRAAAPVFQKAGVVMINNAKVSLLHLEPLPVKSYDLQTAPDDSKSEPQTAL